LWPDVWTTQIFHIQSEEGALVKGLFRAC